MLILFSLISCSHPKVNSSATNINPLNQLFAEYWEQHAKLFPLEATQQGDNRYNDILPNDQTEQSRKEIQDFYKQYLTRLEKIDRLSLNDNDKISYDTFKFEMEEQLAIGKSDLWMIPFQQFWGLPLTMGQIGSGEQYQPFKTVKDYDNWLARVKGFVTWSDSAILNFKAGIKNKFVLPKSLIKKIIPQFVALQVKDPTKSIFYGPITKMPADFSAQDKARLTKAYQEMILKDIVPTYKKLTHFLSHEYLKNGRNSDGISSLKGGKNIYSLLARYWTTTEKTPEEIYQIGLKEVARIHDEMEAVKEQVQFKGSLQQFFNHLKVSKGFYPYQSASEVLNAFYQIHNRIKPKLETLFGKKPKTPFEIRQTEDFRAASSSAEYNQGSPDGSRPGIFYVPIVDAKKFNYTSGMESLFLHEAIPGHHYQISLQQENESLPTFRRFAWYGAYGEGWALYTESLGKELGLYTDPYQYIGALGDEMHRAVRLVVDVGIHLKGMSREQAIDYMMKNEPISKDGAIAEIERYMAIPGQALSYKIGSLKIRELREKYQKELGAKFSLSAFHDEFLKDGCLPLAVVEAKMDEWERKLK